MQSAQDRVARGDELLTALSTVGAVRADHFGANGEHSFCSKRRHDEEKSFNGHSFLAANEERRVQSHRFSGRLAYGEGISERNPASEIDQHHRRSTSGRCWAAADRSPAADIVLELRSSYS